jgi:hypothetical protein
MKNEDIKNSLNKIQPDEAAKIRMRRNIFSHADENKAYARRPVLLRRAVPALILVVVLTAGIIGFDRLYDNNTYKPPLLASEGDAREDMAAPVIDQFRIGDRHYIILSDEMRAEFGLPASISDNDIGEKIAVISAGPDQKLYGKEVYKYIPAGCEAVVAMKTDSTYKLFRFFTFESYNNNQDEDAVRYLKLFGIDSADDIAKIQFIGHSEQAKLQGVLDIRGEIKDKADIKKFYNLYSALKNASDEYFKSIYSYPSKAETPVPDTQHTVGPAPDAQPDVVPPIGSEPAHDDDAPNPEPYLNGRVEYAEDSPLYSGNSSNAGSGDTPVSNREPDTASSGMMDYGQTGTGSVSPSQGAAGRALENYVTIRIYNQRGVYYDTVYYINIGFISRFKADAALVSLIDEYIK